MAKKTALKIFLLLCVQIPAVVKAYAQQINPAGKNIAERFVPPPGYVRVNYAEFIPAVLKIISVKEI